MKNRFNTILVAAASAFFCTTISASELLRVSVFEAGRQVYESAMPVDLVGANSVKISLPMIADSGRPKGCASHQIEVLVGRHGSTGIRYGASYSKLYRADDGSFAPAASCITEDERREILETHRVPLAWAHQELVGGAFNDIPTSEVSYDIPGPEKLSVHFNLTNHD